MMIAVGSSSSSSHQPSKGSKMITTTTTTAPKICSFLSAELLREIQMHLKPRHLAKLLQTCKYMNMMLGTNNEYWTRVAAHLVWRDQTECINNYDNFTIHSDRFRNRLYDMVNLPHGYKFAMDEFIVIIRKEMASDEHDFDDDEDGKDPFKWKACADAPLDVKVRVGMKTFIAWGQGCGYATEADTLLPMREIARKIAVETASWMREGKSGRAKERHMGMVRYINEMDDDNTIPISTKQRLMRGLVNAMTTIEPVSSDISSIHVLSGDVVKSFINSMTSE